MKLIDTEFIVYRLKVKNKVSKALYWTGDNWTWNIDKAERFEYENRAINCAKKFKKDFTGQVGIEKPGVLPVPRKVIEQTPISANMVKVDRI